MRMLYVWTWSWVEDFSSTLRTCILWKGPEGWNIAAHLLNKWGHLHSSSGPAVALKALPRADSRIAWEMSLSLIPVSHISKDHRLQDSSRPKTPQALCFKHKISHLACSHTPSKGHCIPIIMTQDHTGLSIWCLTARLCGKQPNSLSAALCLEPSPALTPSAPSKRKAAWAPEQDINSCWIHKYSNITSFLCKARIFVIKESNPNLFWWQSSFCSLVFNFTGIMKVIWG